MSKKEKIRALYVLVMFASVTVNGVAISEADTGAAQGPHNEHVYTRQDGPLGPTDADFDELGSYFVFPNGATSCAAGIVTSLVALVYSVRPDLDADAVVDIIKQGGDDIGDKGYEIYTGYGRVNFGKTIKIALKWNR